MHSIQPHGIDPIIPSYHLVRDGQMAMMRVMRVGMMIDWGELGSFISSLQLGRAPPLIIIRRPYMGCAEDDQQISLVFLKPFPPIN